jgi:predicted secreted protein
MAISVPAWAEEALRYDQISFSVQAEQSVDNDQLVAVLYAREEGRDARAVADKVNRAVSWGVQRAKSAKGVTVQTLDYRTQPLYDRNGQLSGRWQVSQSLRVESADAAAMSELLGELQQQLAVQSVGYELSAERREAAEQGLIGGALKRFRERAELIAREMGAAGYRVVQMDVNTPNVGAPRPMLMRAAAMEMADAAPPALEAGDQQVRVQVRGSIELLRD